MPPATTPSAATGAPDAWKDEIRSHCEKKHTGHDGPQWDRISWCVDQRTEGYQSVQRFVEVNGIEDGDETPEAKILTACYRKHTSYDGPQWDRISWCVDKQLDGYRKLYP